ncbi:MAG: 1-(5-phosphoribosyl)-5-[(5-phosphoribosylamino)methylideneamino]imidazole-4-carboxamide isomerase [Bacteroidota bacterium]
MRIIPAIDIIEGKCVRLSHGDYATKKVYNDNPVEVAKAFESAGIKYLHVVDLDGAKVGKVINWKVLENICKSTSLKVDFGGGLRTTKEVEKVFDSGVSQITGGSIAVKNPQVFVEWLDRFGADRIILGMDLKDRKVAIHGWLDTFDLSWQEMLADYSRKGIKYVICTDVSRDGALTGPAIELYKEIKTAFPDIQLVASGGVSGEIDLEELEAADVDGVIIGKAIYEGRITLENLAALV